MKHEGRPGGKAGGETGPEERSPSTLYSDPVRRPVVYNQHGAPVYKNLADTVLALRVVGGELASLGGLLICHCGYEITDITSADTAHWLGFGWPTHCGPYTMRWMTAKELAARQAGAPSA